MNQSSKTSYQLTAINQQTESENAKILISMNEAISWLKLNKKLQQMWQIVLPFHFLDELFGGIKQQWMGKNSRM